MFFVIGYSYYFGFGFTTLNIENGANPEKTPSSQRPRNVDISRMEVAVIQLYF